MSTIFSANVVKSKAREFGFGLVGIIRATPSPHLNAYLHWIAAAMHGNMDYLARPDRQARRRDLNVILPGVRSMILVGMDYRATIPNTILTDPARGRIASYAWNLDYHDIMQPKLDALGKWLAAEYKVYVDTGAILERSHAQQAGMGFIGKNTMLIHPRRGSYFFLGEILTTASFDHYDTPHPETMCGTCTRCLTACPTDAFPRPYVLDARRCISYHTIENKGYIDHSLRASFGNWVYGCDVCQEVCPWQRFTTPTDNPAFLPTNAAAAAPNLLDLLTLNDETFREQFHDSPIYRIKRARLVRNACIAAGNWGDPSAVPYLEALLSDESPLVRAHALWGYVQIMGLDDLTRRTVAHESDDAAQHDMKLTLS